MESNTWGRHVKWLFGNRVEKRNPGLGAVQQLEFTVAWRSRYAMDLRPLLDMTAA
jgi:hypothetical protein